MNSEPAPSSRRPLKSRDTRWAAACARALASAGVRPNHISLASIFFGAVAGICFWQTSRVSPGVAPFLFLGAVLGMQSRLLCNLFDGMVAVEGGFRTKSGEIFNELPDRFADVFILVGAAHAGPARDWMPWLGWTCALLALLTAYVRALGVAAGGSQQFCGPMAKQHRMAVLTAAGLGAAVLGWLRIELPLTGWALALVAAGALVTVFRRVGRTIRELEAG